MLEAGAHVSERLLRFSLGEASHSTRQNEDVAELCGTGDLIPWVEPSARGCDEEEVRFDATGAPGVDVLEKITRSRCFPI